MSLEAKIDELIAALKENSGFLGGLNARAKSNSTDDEKPTRRSAAKDDDGEEKPARRSSAKPKAPTIKEVETKTKDFLDAAKDDDDYQDRRDVVKKIVAKFEVARMTELAEGDRAAALEMLANTKVSGGRDDDDVV